VLGQPALAEDRESRHRQDPDWLDVGRRGRLRARDQSRPRPADPRDPSRRPRGQGPLPGHARHGTTRRVRGSAGLPRSRPAGEPARDRQPPDVAAAEAARPGPAPDLCQRPSTRRRLSRPRAVFVVTGSELVRGERTDLNGPFLAREALSLGLEPARILIVGDGEEELEAALRTGLDADLCVTSGGLGPTHDDRTVELVARAAGVPLVVDEELRAQIEAVSRAVAERLRRPYADFEPGVVKQATIPAGATSLGLAGTAPGLA